MLQWDSDDESVGEMTRVSDVLGGFTDQANDEEDEIDEMELLQLRNLVQQIKLQTVIGDNFLRSEQKGPIKNPLEALVTPITDEDVDAKYKQLMADHTDLLEERDQLNARINQFKMQGGGHGEEGETEKRLRKERDEARRENQAKKIEVDNLKICQRNLKQFYQDKVNELGASGIKTSNGSASVPLEEYNKLKELHFALNLEHQQSQQRIHQTQENLHEAVRRAQAAEQEIANLRYSRMGMYNQPSNSMSNGGGDGLLGSNPFFQQILQMNQQMGQMPYRR